MTPAEVATQAPAWIQTASVTLGVIIGLVALVRFSANTGKSMGSIETKLESIDKNLDEQVASTREGFRDNTKAHREFHSELAHHGERLAAVENCPTNRSRKQRQEQERGGAST